MVLRLLLHIDVLDHTILSVKSRGILIELVVLLHLGRCDSIEQVEDAGAVPIDQRSRHSNHLFRCPVELRHCLALAGFIGVFVKFIYN